MGADDREALAGSRGAREQMQSEDDVAWPAAMWIPREAATLDMEARERRYEFLAMWRQDEDAAPVGRVDKHLFLRAMYVFHQWREVWWEEYIISLIE